ncbi:hypothetical protein BDB00DRAFT_61123 [Zychaea mexicana]|uniref:uncharacterized protein n=1 Tax=Zychaea mexicana TaxID=64656 RepID=UPI0022FEE011|nr:uncharacterized protein BDB00DRAFT_61123 [Zychaea mexicana]KAI9488208.1 hypothetical protein BDB00DRAFT_61123 [Zychaea mexicana]
MEFEDIVDMDWLNSNTTTDESLLTSSSSPSMAPIKSEPLHAFSPSAALSDYCHDSLYGFSDQPIMWRNDFPSTDLDMLEATPCSPASSSLPDKQESSQQRQEKNVAAVAPAQPPIAPMSELVMPSTEHIKQLIEIAKRHLALREQQQQEENPKQEQQQQQQQPQAQEKQQQQQQHVIKQEEPEKAQEISQQSGDLQRLYNETAPMSFFVHPTAVSTVPDTVAPESLMKSSSPTPASTSTSTSTTRTTTTTAAAAAAMPDSPRDERAFSPSPPPTSAPAQASANRRASSVSLAGGLTDEAMTLEAYAVSDGIDIKKLTPKERRQLRNKISARNFRVRRKEYINTLEAQVDEHKKHAERLKTRLDDVEEENKQLRLEVDSLRRQNQLLQQQQQPKSSSSSSNSVVAGPSSPGSPRVSSPIPKPNLNKDISMLGSKASETYRHDTRILVSNAVMPVWDYDRIFTAQQQQQQQQQQQKQQQQQQQQILAPPEQVMHLAGYILSMFVQLHGSSSAATTTTTTTTTSATDASHSLLASSSSPTIVELSENGEEQVQMSSSSSSSNIFDAPLLPDDRDFSSEDAWEKATAVPPTAASPAYMEYLYDTLIMSALSSNAHTDKSFWWWDTPAFHQ